MIPLCSADGINMNERVIDMRYLGCILCMSLLAFSVPAQTMDSRQSADSIRTAIEAVVAAELEQTGTDYRIDQVRLENPSRLSECERPLEAFILSGQRGSGYFSVGVRCNGIKPWTSHHKVRVSVYQTVVILKQPVRQGARIEPSNLTLERREMMGQRGGYFTDAASLAGQLAKRTLPGGLMLGPEHLTTPNPVSRGQQVNIQAQSAGIDITMPGIALSDGRLGQRIRVRNTQSGRIVEGSVTRPGVVTVD